MIVSRGGDNGWHALRHTLGDAIATTSGRGFVGEVLGHSATVEHGVSAKYFRALDPENTRKVLNAVEARLMKRDADVVQHPSAKRSAAK